MTGQPPPVRVIAYRPDGTETDVTEGVQILYDTVVASMDWGSGFLDHEEAHRIVRTAQACGFETPTEAREVFMSYLANHQSGPGGLLRCQVCGMDVNYGYRWDGRNGTSGEHRWFHTDGSQERWRREDTGYVTTRLREIPSDHDVDLWPRHAGDAAT